MVNANWLSEAEENIYGYKSLLLISDAQPVMHSIHLDAADILLKRTVIGKNVNGLLMSRTLMFNLPSL